MNRAGDGCLCGPSYVNRRFEQRALLLAHLLALVQLLVAQSVLIATPPSPRPEQEERDDVKSKECEHRDEDGWIGCDIPIREDREGLLHRECVEGDVGEVREQILERRRDSDATEVGEVFPHAAERTADGQSAHADASAGSSDCRELMPTGRSFSSA